MLVLLPPSEGKTSARRGKPLDLQTLSWPELTPARERLVDALIELASGDRRLARERLALSERMDDEVERDTKLRSAPTLKAADLYTGVLYDGLDLASLDTAARRWANRNLVIVSSLFGTVRLNDRIPPYRLGICTRLPGIGALTSFWREQLGSLLVEAAGRDLVVDLRSNDYAATWRPRGPLAARTVAVHVRREGVVASHDAKYTRGLVARQLSIAGERLRRPDQLVDVLAPAFDVRLDRAGLSWRLEVLL
ncbi:MAG: uncharacterized protein QOK42_2325 [Frankiaceae bacterium]|nr:uncharacterized protein [Frankiaceae bacterium]